MTVRPIPKVAASRLSERGLAALCLAALCIAGAAPSTVAQNLPVRGAEATLDVATWNLYFFGDDDRAPDDDIQIANAVEVIRQSGVDLWSLQEIEDPDDFDRLLDALGDGWRGELLNRTSNILHLAFVYRTSVVQVTQIGRILAQYSHEFAGRLPLQVKAEITLPDTTFTALFIALHMKCCGDTASWERRQEASTRLKTHLDVFYPDVPVIVLGDFNDELTHSISSGRPSPYENFLDDSENYSFATRELSEAGKHTFCFSNDCTSGSTIDHILISDEFFESFIVGSSDTYRGVLDPQNGIPDYRSSTSDHLPVLAHFEFSQGTNSEAPAEHPLRISDVFPNPVDGTAHVTLSLPVPAHITIDIIDISGRIVRRFEFPNTTAGSQTVRLDDLDLPSGSYVLRAQLAGHSFSKPFIVIR